MFEQDVHQRRRSGPVPYAKQGVREMLPQVIVHKGAGQRLRVRDIQVGKQLWRQIIRQKVGGYAGPAEQVLEEAVVWIFQMTFNHDRRSRRPCRCHRASERT